MRNKVLGNEGMFIGIALAGAMSAITMFVTHTPQLTTDLGICLPSPNLWPITPLWSWILNLVLILGLGITLRFFNKTFSLVQTTDTVLEAMFLIMVASNQWICGMLSASMIMCLVNVLALFIIFGCYRSPNATQQLFVIASMISLGSMFQYSYIFLIPAYLAISAIMKCLRFKEFVAFLMGLAAPYWIGVGLGIIPVDAFTMPVLVNPFNEAFAKTGVLVGLLNVAISALVAVILALTNMVKLYAGNTRRRQFNNSVMVLGFILILCMIFDFMNLRAYLASFYLTAAVQIANTFSLRATKRGTGWITFIIVIYVAMFALMTDGF